MSAVARGMLVFLKAIDISTLLSTRKSLCTNLWGRVLGLFLCWPLQPQVISLRVRRHVALISNLSSLSSTNLSKNCLCDDFQNPFVSRKHLLYSKRILEHHDEGRRLRVDRGFRGNIGEINVGKKKAALLS